VLTLGGVGRESGVRRGRLHRQRHQRLRDDQYLPVAAEAGATVVATHIRLRPRVADPDPHYDDVTATVVEFLSERRQRALEVGVAHDRIVVDAGLDLGKTAAQSLQLLRDSDRLAGLGAPLLLSLPIRPSSACCSICR